MNERRRTRRFTLPLRGVYASLSWMGDGEVVNISSGGMLFRLVDEPPKQPNGLARLYLEWPAEIDERVKLQVYCKCRVVRTSGKLVALALLGYEFKTKARMVA